jgi:hypothetical protein
VIDTKGIIKFQTHALYPKQIPRSRDKKSFSSGREGTAVNKAVNLKAEAITTPQTCTVIRDSGRDRQARRDKSPLHFYFVKIA